MRHIFKKTVKKKMSARTNEQGTSDSQETVRKMSSPLDRHKRKLLGKLCHDLDYLEGLTERLELGNKGKKGTYSIRK